MHYGNGRMAKNGDKVIVLRKYGPPQIGILYDAVPGVNECNGKIAPISLNDACPDLREVLHIDDLKAFVPENLALVENSSVPDEG